MAVGIWVVPVQFPRDVCFICNRDKCTGTICKSLACRPVQICIVFMPRRISIWSQFSVNHSNKRTFVLPGQYNFHHLPRRLALPPPFGRASPPPQLCGPMSSSVGLRRRFQTSDLSTRYPFACQASPGVVALAVACPHSCRAAELQILTAKPLKRLSGRRIRASMVYTCPSLLERAGGASRAGAPRARSRGKEFTPAFFSSPRRPSA